MDLSASPGTSPGRRLPLTFFGRSPVDKPRLQLAVAGNLLLGAFMMFVGGALAIVVGVAAFALGGAVLVLTGFGRRSYYALSRPVRAIVMAGALIGYGFVSIFYYSFRLVLWAIQFFGRR